MLNDKGITRSQIVPKYTYSILDKTVVFEDLLPVYQLSGERAEGLQLLRGLGVVMPVFCLSFTGC